MGDREGNRDSDITSLLSAVPYDQWVLVQPSGQRPSARYKHAAEVVQEKLYVVGGSRNGRYLSDIQVFDFRNLEWTLLSPGRHSVSTKSENCTSEEVFPTASGHSLVKWKNKLLVVAGHSKESSDTVSVWSINLETHDCSFVKTFGKVPTARGGQSVTVVGSRLIMFGGEDRKRFLLNDLYILDLNSMTWGVAETKKTSPAPRFDHTAALHADKYLLIFGGSSHSICLNDLHILDLHTVQGATRKRKKASSHKLNWVVEAEKPMEWSQPETQGASVSPRGGHVGAIIDENWYIVGGGDNRSGAPETIVLSMSKLVWSVTTSVKERDPLSSEGLSLCTATIDGEKLLIAFGGYNGKYNNEVHVLKPKPRDSIQPRLFQSPAAAAAAASVTAAYALSLTAATDYKNLDTINTKDARRAKAGTPPNFVMIDTDTKHAENKALESRILELRDKNSRLKKNLDGLNDSHTELSMELQSVQGQLAAERSRCFKLEVYITDMQKRLESLSFVEHELEVLRDQKSQIEQEMAVAHKQRSGSVWQWVTSTNSES